MNTALQSQDRSPEDDDVFRAADPEWAAFLRSVDWRATPLGPPSSWPPALRSALDLVLAAAAPMSLLWGPTRLQLYNRAYAALMGNKHPAGIGREAVSSFPEAVPVGQPPVEAAYAGHGSFHPHLRFPLRRQGALEETYFSVSNSPIRDAAGAVVGVLQVAIETTREVLAARRLRLLHDLATAGGAPSRAEVLARLGRTLGQARDDLPFALLYLSDGRGGFELATHAGIDPGTPASPAHLDGWGTAPDGPGWPVPEDGPAVVGDLRARFGAAPAGARQAVVVRLPEGPDPCATGVLVAGAPPLRPLDRDGLEFLGLVAATVGAEIVGACHLEAAHEQADRLAELDRAKTTFFGDISHELRTPLTLVLGPVTDLLARDLDPAVRTSLEAVRRSALRLQRLVDGLLDFARFEAGRVTATFEATALGPYTAELASLFRTAMDHAGLRLEVDCPDLPQPVYVDRDLWEKLVQNLLSNALKFTRRGAVRVLLEGDPDEVRLVVSDTGIGIPAEHLPRIFERFHRVVPPGARTVEGTGIGLSLVAQIARLHGGRVEVESREGRGTRFTVHLPLGWAHLPADRVREASREAHPMAPAPLVEEALGWVAPAAEPEPPAVEPGERASILVVDDHRDLRAYLTRLLRGYAVRTAADGAEALNEIRRAPPDLVVTDLRMPGIDGLQLLAALRADPRTRALPVVLVSARTGPEATVQGLAAGADAYLEKPFGRKELLAVVEAQLRAVRARREALAAREEVLATVAHDLRGPLHAVSLHADLVDRLSRRCPDEDRLRQQAEGLRVAVRRADRLVADLLDVTRIEAGRLTLQLGPHDLAAVVAEVVALYGPAAAAKGVHLRSAGEGPLPARCDAARLVQALSNLVDNAIKFTPAGGAVAVRAEADDGTARIVVTDTGVGIPPEDLPRLFEPFWQRPGGERRGLGLGLAIVRGVVEAHGGSVTVRSAPGEGSTFTIVIPRDG